MLLAAPAASRPVRALSVVIPAKNARGLARTLASVREAARRASPVIVEVVVVDDGSTDDTAAVAVAGGARVVHAGGIGWTIGPYRQDIGAVRNLGIRTSGGEAVVSLDADCIVPPDYLATMARALERHALVTADRRPLDPRAGQRAYRALADVAHALHNGGTVEWAVAFRREVCPDAVCFSPRGYAEIKGLTRRPGLRLHREHGTAVASDLGGWREDLGNAVLVGGGALLATAALVGLAVWGER